MPVFLGELEGSSGDLDLRLFATVSAFSSAESGSGKSPDRAQICALLMCDPVLIFFLSRFWDRQNGICDNQGRSD